MSSFSTFLIGLSYLLLSVAFGAVIYEMDLVPAPTAMVLGFLVYLVCAQAHHFFMRLDDRRQTRRQLNHLRKVTRLLSEELEEARNSVKQAAFATEVKAQARNKEIVSEVRLLEALIGQMADGVEKKARSRLRAAAKDMAAAELGTSGHSAAVLKNESAKRLGQGEAAAPASSNSVILRDNRPDPATDSGTVSGREAVLSQLSEDQLIELVQAALNDNRVDVYLQPIVSLPQRRVRFYESFSYLRTEDGRPIKPNHYVPLAEGAGLMSFIDNLLLFRCVQIVRRLVKRQPDMRLFCNISMHSLRDRYFFPQFLEFLSTNRDLSNHLIFEFGQQTYENAGPVEKANLRQLSELGYCYSLDKVTRLDLNLGELRERNFKFVKIDAALLIAAAAGSAAPEDWTDEQAAPGADEDGGIETMTIIDAEVEDGADAAMGEDRHEAAVFEDSGAAKTAGLPSALSHIHPADLRELFDRYGLDIVVEKLETERDVAEVVDLDVDYGQGYLFGAPKPVDRDGIEIDIDASVRPGHRTAS